MEDDREVRKCLQGYKQKLFDLQNDVFAKREEGYEDAMKVFLTTHSTKQSICTESHTHIRTVPLLIFPRIGTATGEEQRASSSKTSTRVPLIGISPTIHERVMPMVEVEVKMLLSFYI